MKLPIKPLGQLLKRYAGPAIETVAPIVITAIVNRVSKSRKDKADR